MKIILISGQAQHGKDTSARYIKEALEDDGNEVIIAHYAWLLKELCKEFFEWDGKKDDKGRSLLQRVGTDVIREKHPNYWSEFLANFLSMFQDEWEYVIIPDTRFPDEIQVMRDAFGWQNVIHVKVERPDFDNGLSEEQRNHPSERALDDTKPDFTILNDATELSLAKRCREWVNSELLHSY